MARMARIVMYVTDVNADVDDYENYIVDYVEHLIDRSDLYIESIESEEKNFEWDDDCIINQIDCSKEIVAKFFRELEDNNACKEK